MRATLAPNGLSYSIKRSRKRKALEGIGRGLVIFSLTRGTHFKLGFLTFFPILELSKVSCTNLGILNFYYQKGYFWDWPELNKKWWIILLKSIDHLRMSVNRLNLTATKPLWGEFQVTRLQDFVVLIWSTSEDRNAEFILQPPSSFEPISPWWVIQCLNHLDIAL